MDPHAHLYPQNQAERVGASPQNQTCPVCHRPIDPLLHCTRTWAVNGERFLVHMRCDDQRPTPSPQKEAAC